MTKQPSAPDILSILSRGASTLPIGEIHDFNRRERDAWVAAKAATVPAGAVVLDVGAGTCPYRGLFKHCTYKTHDFKAYEGFASGAEGSYGQIDYVSDITALPLADGSVDAVLCTEVFEHVPDPVSALRELARIVKPGGLVFITAPLGSGLHQEPFHFYGGYTPHWYRHWAPAFGLVVDEVTPNGGFFKHLAQECARVAWTMEKHAAFHGPNREAVGALFGEVLPRYLFALDEACPMEQFTVGFHVACHKGGKRA